MSSVFDQEKIKRAAQFAFKKIFHQSNAFSEEQFIEVFQQAIKYIEKEVACRMEYENMSGSIGEITNYDQESTWRLYATRKDWDFLYDDNKKENDAQEKHYKEQIIDQLLCSYSHCDTKENLSQLSLVTLEELLENARYNRFKKNKN